MRSVKGRFMGFPEVGVVDYLQNGTLTRGRELRMDAKQTQSDSMDLLLLESIDEVLTDLLGRRTREAIYDYLARNRLIARSEVPKRLDDFFNLMHETFGKGATTIGRVIAKRLYAKLGWEFADLPSFELTDYVDAAKSRLEREFPKSERTH
jgi:hypothetical protein